MWAILHQQGKKEAQHHDGACYQLQPVATVAIFGLHSPASAYQDLCAVGLCAHLTEMHASLYCLQSALHSHDWCTQSLYLPAWNFSEGKALAVLIFSCYHALSYSLYSFVSVKRFVCNILTKSTNTRRSCSDFYIFKLRYITFEALLLRILWLKQWNKTI